MDMLLPFFIQSTAPQRVPPSQQILATPLTFVVHNCFVIASTKCGVLVWRVACQLGCLCSYHVVCERCGRASRPDDGPTTVHVPSVTDGASLISILAIDRVSHSGVD